MPGRILLCAGALLLGGVGGYFAAASDQPTRDDAASAQNQAREGEFDLAREQARVEGFETGRSEGFAAGKKAGTNKGQTKGTADGEAEAQARDAEAAAEAAEEALVYCLLGPNELTTAEDCQQREDIEGYCGGPDSPEC